MEPTSVRDVQAPEWLLGERPRPQVAALVGAAGGLVLLAGMFALFEILEDDSVRVGGIGLSLMGLLVGVVLMFVEPVSGSLRSAGVAVAAGAVPPLAFLLVNDPAHIDDKGDFLVAGLLAVVLWAVLFAVGPGRGHGLFVGLALAGLWATALIQTTPEMLFSPFGAVTSVRSGGVESGDHPFEREFDADEFERQMREQMEEDRRRREEELRTRPQPTYVPPPPPPVFEPPPFPGPGESLGETELIQFVEGGAPDEPPIAPAVVSFLFGLVYLAGAVFLDGLGLRRVGSAVLAAAIVALTLGSVFVGPRHGATAAGIAALTVAVLLVGVGIVGDRRFTAWLGAATLAFGITAIVGDAFDDPGAGVAVALLVVGAALVAAGWFAAGAMTPPASPSSPLPPAEGQPPRRIVI